MSTKYSVIHRIDGLHKPWGIEGPRGPILTCFQTRAEAAEICNAFNDALASAGGGAPKAVGNPTEPPQHAAPERGDAQQPIIDAGNAMRRELGKLCEIQLADGMMGMALKSGAACDAWDAALSGLVSGPMSDEEIERVQKYYTDNSPFDTHADKVLYGIGVAAGLRHARTEGYLSGLGVEEEPDGEQPIQ